MTTKRTLIRDLSAACLGSRPVNKDWTEGNFGENEGWEAWSAEECEKCHQAVLLMPGQGNEDHCDIDNFAEAKDEYDGELMPCHGHVSMFEGPMMSYWYPIADFGIAPPHDSPHEAAPKFLRLPLCIVKVDDQYGLALTGGGTDLTWEIVEAFTVLGYLPPVHFAKRMPAICGRGVSPKDHYLLKACKRSLVLEMRNLRWGMRELASAREFGEKHEAERAARAASSEIEIGGTGSSRCRDLQRR